MPSPILAAQLYTVRELCKENYPRTLQQVAALGYRAVELAGTYGHSASEVKRIADDNGLTIISSHVGLAVLEANLDVVLDDHATMGCAHVAVPAIPKERITNQAGWLGVAHSLNQLAQRCQARGVALSYHNHAYEFETKFNGQYALDFIFANAPLVQIQLDVYWAWKPGIDPAAYLKQFNGRAPTIHLKDADQQDDSHAEVGSGQLDWQAILSAANAVGVWGYIVEQDYYKRPPLDCLKSSFEFLRSRGLA
jgi:sugar phosphate isomerase/epimerase